LTNWTPALTLPFTDGRQQRRNTARKKDDMSEKNASQVREAQSAWKKAADEQLARMELAYGEVARMQEQSLEQSRHAVDEMAKLTKDSFNYFGQLSAEWRKLSLEATRKAAEFLTTTAV
jgi:flagellar biosynthesis component FlhA